MTEQRAPAAPTTVAGAFADQMAAVVRDGRTPGRYGVDVDERWVCPTVPHGGLMAAVAARAMAAELGQPGQRLRSLTTVFAAAVPAGPVTVDVDVLRRGRSMSQAVATVRPAGGDAPGHTTVAVFGAPRPGFELIDLAPPAVDPPERCPSYRDPRPDGVVFVPIPFWENVEGRPALGHAPWEDYTPTTSECARWYRFDEPPRAPDGRLDPLALVTLCDTMPSSVAELLGPGHPEWWGPSTDLTVHLLGEARSEWILAGLRTHRAADGYASVEIRLWDPEAGLVAYGTQVMYFTFPNGAAPAGK